MKRALGSLLLSLQIILSPVPLATPASAADLPEPARQYEAKKRFNEQVALIPEELASPWTEARPWLLTGAALTAAVAMMKKPVVGALQAHFVNQQPLGQASKYGNWGGLAITNGAYILGMWGHWVSTNDRKSFRRGASMLKLTAYAEATTFAIKYATASRRPDGRDALSFPSGHTTAAFSFASYVTAEHGWGWGAPALALAVLTGASRMNDNRHYIHDVLGGATIGTVWGLGVHAVQAKSGAGTDEKLQASWKPQLFPLVADGVYGLGAAMEF